jgi:hypothetical protein
MHATQSPERRRARSGVPGEAVGHYLLAAAERHGYEEIALADCCGQLIAGSAGAVELAAAAPLAEARRAPQDKIVLDAVRAGRPLRVWSVLVDGVSCYLATLGGDPAPPHDAPLALNRIVGHA